MRGSGATKPEGAKRPSGGNVWEGGFPPPTVGRFLNLGVRIMYSGACSNEIFNIISNSNLD